jgi:mannose-6-phosphate isomerase-like protein (cupin superfamily)
MLLRDLGDDRLEPAYGILFQQIYPHGGEDLADWGIGRSVIEPGGGTARHAHDEHELFIILSGSGVMTIEDDQQPVGAGQGVLIPQGSRHDLANASPSERLVFLNVYWPERLGSVHL